VSSEARPPESREAAGREGLSIRPQHLRLSPQYRRLRDTILRPHLRLTESRYFWEKWKPRLGPDATVLIMEVRARCGQALESQFSRFTPNGTGVDPSLPGAGDLSAEGCTVSAAELAAACGFSRVTLWRLLQREDVRQFVRVEHNYIYDRRLGKKRRTLSTYHVLMEDPLVPEDEPRLQALIEAAGAPGARIATTTAPSFQTETEVVDSSPPTFQNETAKSGSNQKPQNVPLTLFKERLGEPGTIPFTSPLRGGNPSRLGSLLGDAWLPPTPGDPANRAVRAGRANESAGPAPAGSSAPDLWQKFPQFAHHVEEAEMLLGDQHSRGFYISALKRLYPTHMGIWQRALGAAREQKQIRRSRGALFTRLLRTFAAEAGISLGGPSGSSGAGAG
jgi:hypothetical protein